MFARRIDLVYNPACEGSVPDVLAWPCPETVLSNSCVWEWQEQVEQAQSMLHELLGAVAELSGVDLPGMAKGTQREGDSSRRLPHLAI